MNVPALLDLSGTPYIMMLCSNQDRDGAALAIGRRLRTVACLQKNATGSG